ncbi:glycosyltransferase family 39 protein [Tellurirhabdus bombi]|uniref:glycosyltransferase family 39 protein n=1 Tax=Tellurirhabdus bombi TaxID=2907205 RepID=UPI001F3A1FB6|nr:glycosyltransferase family 39 protein [Tellurirhabdus bombi]
MSLPTKNSRSLLILGGIVLLAFVLRLYRVGTYGIYFDEKSTLLISQGVCVEGANQHDVFSKPYFSPKDFWSPKTFADFIEANIRGDIGNSPAYYGVLWVWMEIFGMEDTAMRFPSVLFSTFTIILLYVFVRRHFKSESLALISSAIAAIEPFFVSYSHMARNYSMTFFLTLLATHLFLLILEKESRPKNKLGLYFAYCFTIAASVLSHYLTVTVFMCHGIYLLLYVRQTRIWVNLSIVAVVALGVVSSWFIFGGGKYTFFTLDYQAKFYRNLALTNPYNNGFGIILPATVSNVLKRSLPIWSDLVFFTNGLAAKVGGLRNFALSLGFGVAATAILHLYRKKANPPVWVKVAFPLLLVVGLPFYTINPIHFFVLSAALPLYYLLLTTILEDTNRQTRPLIVFLVVLSLVPTLFLLLMAFRSGHTYGITQRYSGFSFPYATILVAMTFRKLASLRQWFSWPLGAAIAVQVVFIGMLLVRIYQDSDPKYTYFGNPRIANPMLTAANKIKAQYQPGDTVLYPSLRRKEYTDIDKNGLPVSVIDAQLVNIYLPKEADYYQRIDSTERDKIVLLKGKTGQKITIFDFEGSKYRY